ncbi:protein charlatan [Anabrus simplex]|uniref:protein charlatan n=1 Tax=Anabrus simplex TaxID=316456 RepID=UPI0035A34DC8
MMEVVHPVAAANMDCYEDMFKEITRKLYGEEGLPDIEGTGTVVPEYDSEGNGGSAMGDGHGSTLTAFGLAALMQNGFPPPPGMLSAHHHHLQEAKYRASAVNMSASTQHAEDKWVPSEESLQWTSSKIASYNPAQKLFRCTDCECVGFLSRVAEHWLGTHANVRVFQCPQCPYSSAWARCVRMHLTRQHNVADDGNTNPALLCKENPILEEVTKYLQRLKNKVESSPPVSNNNNKQHQQQHHHHHHQDYHHQNNSHNGRISGPSLSSSSGGENNSGGANKRYCCSYCPYATDRRDLFTRHENIHREEKPFQCYVCQKQFNRADHVKKHFLRMHRDYPYDLNRIRRQPPKNASGMSYYHKYNNNNNNNNQPPPPPPSIPNGVRPDVQNSHHQPLHQPIVTPPMHQIHNPHSLNIPGGFSSMAFRSGLSQNGGGSVSGKPKSPYSLNGCNAKSHGGKTKKKGEKRYSCCYCSWSGVDNWCLKRHLNTHLKPFVCVLCDYKAARSERLATHVLKVHNKRACGRCSFLADDQAQLSAHLQEHHPLEHRNNRSSNNVLRNVDFTSHPASMPTSFGHQGISSTTSSSGSSNFGYNNNNTVVKRDHYESAPAQYPTKPRQHYGAARLFHYMEASDTSEPEESGGESPSRVDEEEEDPPPFMCRDCGCEFVDDSSLETHNLAYHQQERVVPVSQTTEAFEKTLPYRCSVCGCGLSSQVAMMEHMRSHTGLLSHCRVEDCNYTTSLGAEVLREHINTAHGDDLSCIVRCPHCGLAAGTGDALRRHQGQHHSPDSNCSLCDRIFRKHLPMSKDSYTNNLCNNKLCNGGGIMDSNMNHSSSSDMLLQRTDEGNSRDSGPKRSRKQSQPRRVIPEVPDVSEIQVLRHPGYIRKPRPLRRRRRTSSAALSRLRDKHTGLLLTRKRSHCNWCRQHNYTFPYHTPASLALHGLWRHSKPKFQCEHCEEGFRHRYQVVLHASRKHITINRINECPDQTPSSLQLSEPIITVPEPMKEPVLLSTPVPAPSAPSFSNIQVPDTLHINKSVYKDSPVVESPVLNIPQPAPLPPMATSSSSSSSL